MSKVGHKRKHKDEYVDSSIDLNINGDTLNKFVINMANLLCLYINFFFK